MSGPDALVIGAGPAGLMAAEHLARLDHKVLVADQKPSVGRKFLMAGKSGLNLTKAVSTDQAIAAYSQGHAFIDGPLAAFGPDDVRAWARGLGIDLFTGSTGRVFPRGMKASPLLRAWLARLQSAGVTIRTRWRWVGFGGAAARFETPDGAQSLTPKVTILALGGGSWARLGSDGEWLSHLADIRIPTHPFAPSNAGLAVGWSDHMARHFGSPVKGIALQAGDQTSRGEVVVTARGVEGGGLYPLSPALRAGHPLRIDLAPDVPLDRLAQRLSRPRGKQSLAQWLRKAARLDPIKIALVMEFARPMPADVAATLKSLPLVHQGFLPLDGAISTVGGIGEESVDQTLMLKDRPGTFVAGEMLDWDAPTGGYLLTACLAQGRAAGLAAANWMAAD